MAMFASDCTNHGRRPSDSKVVFTSTGAVTRDAGSGSGALGLVGSTFCSAWGFRFMRDGTLMADLKILSSLSSSLTVGEVRRRFLGLTLSRVSESDAALSLSDADAVEFASESALPSVSSARFITSFLRRGFTATDGMVMKEPVTLQV